MKFVKQTEFSNFAFRNSVWRVWQILHISCDACFSFSEMTIVGTASIFFCALFGHKLIIQSSYNNRNYLPFTVRKPVHFYHFSAVKKNVLARIEKCQKSKALLSVCFFFQLLLPAALFNTLKLI